MNVFSKFMMGLFSLLWLLVFVVLTVIYLPFLLIATVVDTVRRIVQTFRENWKKFREDMKRDFTDK